MVEYKPHLSGAWYVLLTILFLFWNVRRYYGSYVFLY